MKNEILNFIDQIQSKVHFIRGHRVMLDSDLAQLYRVETSALNRAVRRNLERFPTDFMFQLTDNEEVNLICHIGISSLHGGTRHRHHAFTEHGIAMLSSVLRSDTAIKVNIEIMRAFVKMKYSEVQNQEIWDKFRLMEQKYDASFSGVFEAIREMLSGELPNQHRKIKPMNE